MTMRMLLLEVLDLDPCGGRLEDVLGLQKASLLTIRSKADRSNSSSSSCRSCHPSVGFRGVGASVQIHPIPLILQ